MELRSRGTTWMPCCWEHVSNQWAATDSGQHLQDCGNWDLKTASPPDSMQPWGAVLTGGRGGFLQGLLPTFLALLTGSTRTLLSFCLPSTHVILSSQNFTEVTKAMLGVRKPTDMGTACSSIAVDHACRMMATWAELGSYRDSVLYPPPCHSWQRPSL